MPQKRNPDVFELVRGRTATAQACLVECWASRQLPSGYQRTCSSSRRRCSAHRRLRDTLAIMALRSPVALRARAHPPRRDIHAAAEANALW